jgi:glutamate N-acetyltransferase / amino-acid N-acetyltransferase
MFSAAARSRSLLSFKSASEHLTWLTSQSKLPAGFRVGSTSLTFQPAELPTKTAKMGLTLITLDAPTDKFAAMFTRNAFPGAPIIIGRKRVANGGPLQAVLINSKISNVCAPGGVDDAERLCAAAAKVLGLSSGELILPSSTGVIGWKLPVDAMLNAIPAASLSLQSDSILPAASGIMTTDSYPKVRSIQLDGGARIVGIAKGAGMIEPDLATMLVYILTDVSVSADTLRSCLASAVHGSFNSMSIDSDTSTSDTVLALSSGIVPLEKAGGSEVFTNALATICAQLAEDVARNGEGVQHVMRVEILGAPTEYIARKIGKAVVNSPLFKCAVAGNDPNVGRLVAAVGKCVGAVARETNTLPFDLSKTRMKMGNVEIFSHGAFNLAPTVEKELVTHLKEAQLWESTPKVTGSGLSNVDDARIYKAQDVSYVAPISYPPHERVVEVSIVIILILVNL